MKRSIVVSSILTACLLGISLVVPAQQPCPTTLENCPDEGCGGGNLRDPELNKMKNRNSIAQNPQARSLGQIRAMREPSPWPIGKERSQLAAREDTAVVVRAYLRHARESGSETTNCQIPGRANNDFHLDLISFKNDPKARSVTAEITPRFRKPGWTLGKLEHLFEEKAYVRVTGWLMLDTFHISRRLTRSTNWEIHPVTKFEVCTSTITDCRNGNGWQNLEDFEIR
jgi:hypothetical protein